MKTKFVIPIVALIAVSFAVLAFSATSVTPQAVSQKIGYTGVACVQVIRADGSVEPQQCNHNLITTKGLEMVKNALNGTSVNYALTNLSIGGNTSALSASDTDLANIISTNGGAPATATYARIGTGNSSLTYQWTETTAASIPINVTGIYNTTGAGTNLFAEAAWTPSTTLQVGDKLNVTRDKHIVYL